jgi:hypothetical protein
MTAFVAVGNITFNLDRVDYVRHNRGGSAMAVYLAGDPEPLIFQGENAAALRGLFSRPGPIAGGAAVVGDVLVLDDADDPTRFDHR